MSLLDKASLVVTPNAYKASKLYSVIPSDGTGDMTVVRATTATRVNSAGLIESVVVNVPRIDYTNGSCPSLLVEGQRTNLALRSEEFDNAYWVKSAIGGTISLTPNYSNSPSGVLNADRLLINNVGSAYVASSTIVVTNAVSYTMSMYIKSNTASSYVYQLRDGYSGVVSSNLTITPTWQRFTLTFASLGTIAEISLRTLAVGASDISIWGAQLELGSYATSLIPTVASIVTRNADVLLSIGTPLLLNDFSIFMDFKLIQNNQGVGYMIFGSVDGADISRIYIDSLDNMSLTIASTTNSLGKAQLNINTNYKVCFKRSGSTLKYFKNGILINTFTVQTNQFKLSTFFNSVDGGGDTSKYNTLGFLKTGIAFNTALTDTECVNLTTL